MSVPLEPRNPHLHWSSGSHFFIIFVCFVFILSYRLTFIKAASQYIYLHSVSAASTISCASLSQLSRELVCCPCFLTVVQLNILILHAGIRSHLISCMLSNCSELFLCGQVCVCVLMY